jgi:hypothetical protein
MLITMQGMMKQLQTNDNLILVTVVGYTTIKKAALDEINTETCDLSWVWDAMQVLGETHEQIYKRFENIVYSFRIMEANKWIYP